MKTQNVVHIILSAVVGLQFLGDVMGKMAPFLRQSIQSSLPVHSSSPGLMLKIPTRDKDLLRLKPRKKHLKTHKLMRRLSSEFDKNYMSILRPAGNKEIIVHQADDHLARAVRELNVTLTDASGDRIPLNTSMTQALQSWLVNKGSCPVFYRWEDIGSFFWPRWIKHGYCVSEPSCSWPPGMHCIPAKLKRIKILRWHCRLWRKGRGRKSSRKGGKAEEDSNDTENWAKPLRGRQGKLSKRCKWVKVPYPITDQCYCSC